MAATSNGNHQATSRDISRGEVRMTKELKVGEKAQAFKLVASDDKTYRLADFKGKTVVLYFYPKAMTPGCTQEACDFRDLATPLAEHSSIPLGVSRRRNAPEHSRSSVKNTS